MVKSNQAVLETPVVPGDQKWAQQVRLACVQAMTARAVASQEVYNTERIILNAKALTAYVLKGD